MLTPRKLRLPPADGTMNPSPAPPEHDIPTRASTRMTRSTIDLPHTVIAGVRGQEAIERFTEYDDDRKRCIPVSHCWLPSGDVVIGCSGGQIIRVSLPGWVWNLVKFGSCWFGDPTAFKLWCDDCFQLDTEKQTFCMLYTPAGPRATSAFSRQETSVSKQFVSQDMPELECKALCTLPKIIWTILGLHFLYWIWSLLIFLNWNSAEIWYEPEHSPSSANRRCSQLSGTAQTRLVHCWGGWHHKAAGHHTGQAEGGAELPAGHANHLPVLWFPSSQAGHQQ